MEGRKRKNKIGKTITVCSSAAFFKKAFEIEKKLKELGFNVKLPHTALKMKQGGDFRIEVYKTWFKNKKDYSRKRWLIENHFRKVISGDAILVINEEKNGMKGYIGGNTLMEMAVAFHFKKPIYILNPISEKLGWKEEIFGLHPIFLEGKIERLLL